VQPGQATTHVRADEPEEESPRTLSEYIRQSPPWLISGVVHMLILIVMALWLFIPNIERSIIVVMDDDVYAEELGDPNADDAMDFESENPVDDSVLTPQDLKPVDDPFAAPPELAVEVTGTTSTSTIDAPMIGYALQGRSEGSKASLLGKYGGNKLSEAAVALALEWLARQQRPDGSWSLQGPYSDGVEIENVPAATSMALLAFLGAGHTHQKGKWKQTVAKGAQLLVRQQLEGGDFPGVSAHAKMYTQGQAAIALCELYGMTKDPQFKAAAEKAVEFCVKNQSPEGGWRYDPRDGASDVSVTGWVLMGLQSARFAELPVPDTTFQRITKFLDLATTDGGSLYGYLPNTSEAKASMTAEALLCRQYLGWAREDQRLQKGVEWLLNNNMPDWGRRDVYYWYYATQVMHHMEGPQWTKWNSVMRDMLVKNQVKQGKEAGSWNPQGDEWGPHAGRLYTTCLSVYMLEVYYRHMPIYARAR
jgi:hypothetical protein